MFFLHSLLFLLIAPLFVSTLSPSGIQGHVCCDLIGQAGRMMIFFPPTFQWAISFSWEASWLHFKALFGHVESMPKFFVCNCTTMLGNWAN